MDTSTIQTYDANPSAIAQVPLSSELTAKQAKLVYADDYTHTVDGSKATTVVNVPAGQLPSKARTFARSGTKVTITVVASGDSVTYTVGPHGLSAEVSTAFKLSDNATTTVDLSAVLRVKILPLDERIKGRAAGMVDRLLAKDVKLVEEVTEERGS